MGHTEDRERLMAVLDQHGYAENLEIKFRCKDGSIKTCLMSARMLCLNNEPHFVSITRDITDRKSVEMSLRESEERYRLLFERSSDAIFMVELNTGRNLDANKAAEELTGRTQLELKYMTIADVTSSLHMSHQLQIYAKTVRTTDLGDIVFTRPDGSEKNAMVSLISLKDKIGYLIAHDITEMRKTNELMIHTEKMITVGSLAAGMAHEINNPLGSYAAGDSKYRTPIIGGFISECSNSQSTRH